MSMESVPAPAVSAWPVVKAVTAWNGSSLGQYLTGSVELTVLRVSVPPNTSSEWHTNPTPVAVYVMSGRLDIAVQGGPDHQTIEAG